MSKKQTPQPPAPEAAETPETPAEATPAPETTPANRAVNPGMVTCRVVAKGPMMTAQGVKAPKETFTCSASRAKAYGSLVAIEGEPPAAKE